MSIIYLEDLTVDYDGFKALDRLNFVMDRRELRVVIGPNGAGKTTLLDVISGRVKPAHGRVIFGHNTDLTALRENEIAALGIGRKFQTPSVFVNLTVWDNVELSLRRASKGVFAALRQRHAGEERARIVQTLETVKLLEKADGMAGAVHPACAARTAADFVVRRRLIIAAADQARLGGGPAHVERNNVTPSGLTRD